MCEQNQTIQEKPEDIYKERNDAITVMLVIIWITTLLVGALGRWYIITAPILITTSIMLTVSCVTSVKEKKGCNFHLGICSQYWSSLLLFGAYKLVYWQFAISVLYLVAGIAIVALIGWLRVVSF